MNINWCKLLGHKWVAVFIIGWFKGEKVKFIATECERCKFGFDDLRNTIGKMDNCVNAVHTYSEQYYNENHSK